MFTKFSSKFEIEAVQRIANLVVLEKCCKMRIWVQKSASIQPQTSSLKFARSPCTDPPGETLAQYDPFWCRQTAEVHLWMGLVVTSTTRSDGKATANIGSWREDRTARKSRLHWRHGRWLGCPSRSARRGVAAGYRWDCNLKSNWNSMSSLKFVLI